MRPTPLDRLPQLLVHVQIGYVADELTESVKIIYELAVKLQLVSRSRYGSYVMTNIPGKLSSHCKRRINICLNSLTGEGWRHCRCTRGNLTRCMLNIEKYGTD